jgi:Protein of unknown function (DUF2971)
MTDPFWKTHPRVYHYTQIVALKGIIQTNELWASHIAQMNDQTEFVHAKKLFVDYLQNEVRNWFVENLHRHIKLSDHVFREGGIAVQAEHIATVLIDSIYKVTGNEFYVVSFCGQPLDPYVETNGLLSQWRGYGVTQGYMLVFDTEKLCDLVSAEHQQFAYLGAHFSDVVYSHDDKMIKDDLGTYFADLMPYCLELIFGNEKINQLADKAMTAFVNIATRLKHRAFFEEREVRMVFPRVNKNSPMFALYGKPPPEKPKDKNGEKPIIKLFGKGMSPLPIRKIVVGPHKEKHHMAEELKKLLEPREIEVTISDIPYV